MMKKLNILLIILSLLFTTTPVWANVNHKSGLYTPEDTQDNNDNAITIGITTITTENENGATFCEENLKLKVQFSNLPSDRSRDIGVDVKCGNEEIGTFDASLPQEGDKYVYDYDQIKEKFEVGKTYTITYYRTTGRSTPIGSIDITYKYKATASVNGNAKWSTFVAPFEVTIPKDITVFKPSSISNNSELVLQNISTPDADTRIEANTPVILKGSANWTQEFFSTTDANSDFAISMEGRVVGVLKKNYTIVAAGNTKYILQSKNGGDALFYKLAQDRTAAKNRVYLDLSPRQTANISFVYDEKPTEIDAIEETPNTDITAIYDMSGRNTTCLGRGINIVKYSDGSTKKILR